MTIGFNLDVQNQILAMRMRRTRYLWLSTQLEDKKTLKITKGSTSNRTNQQPDCPKLPPGASYCCTPGKKCSLADEAGMGIVQPSSYQHKCQGCKQVMHGGGPYASK
jgi:hypothetical protein